MTPSLTLSPSTWKWDFSKLPVEAQRAWLAHPPQSQLTRLTADLYAFRQSAGSGVWTIGPLPSLIPLFEAIPIPEPWKPPIPRPAESDPLDLSKLNITFDI